MIRWVPNLLSILRILSVFFIPYYAVKGKWGMALIWIIYGMISDLADGYFARKYGVATEPGESLDLFADALFDIGIIGGLFLTGCINGWMTLILIVLSIYVRSLNLINREHLVYRIGVVISPFYGAFVYILLCGVYAVKALSTKGFNIFLIVAFLVFLAVIILKRKRIREMVAEIFRALGIKKLKS